MSDLKFFIKIIDRLNNKVGESVKWLLLVVTVLSAFNAISRKMFGLTSNGMLEAQWYIYAAVFLLGGAYCLNKNSHVRIDFLSSRIGAKNRNIVDIFGLVFILAPFCLFMIYLSWFYFLSTWESGEMSNNAGGLVRWPVYLIIPTGFFLLFLQSLSEIAKRYLFLKGEIPDPIKEVEDFEKNDLSLNELEGGVK